MAQHATAPHASEDAAGGGCALQCCLVILHRRRGGVLLASRHNNSGQYSLFPITLRVSCIFCTSRKDLLTLKTTLPLAALFLRRCAPRTGVLTRSFTACCVSPRSRHRCYLMLRNVLHRNGSNSASVTVLIMCSNNGTRRRRVTSECSISVVNNSASCNCVLPRCTYWM